MPVCHQRRFIFVHIPKTGGTSIQHALVDAGLALEWTGEATDEERRTHGFTVGWRHHVQAAILRRILGPHTWHDYFTFAFVRNPWDLMVSIYHYHRMLYHNVPQMRARFPHLAARFASAPGFAEWLCAGIYTEPQTTWLTDGSGDLLVGFIGRFERLEQDFQTVAARIGITATLPHLMRGEHPAYATLYDTETRDIVARHFAEDIRRFRYEFGG